MGRLWFHQIECIIEVDLRVLHIISETLAVAQLITELARMLHQHRQAQYLMSGTSFWVINRGDWEVQHHVYGTLGSMRSD